MSVCTHLVYTTVGFKVKLFVSFYFSMQLWLGGRHKNDQISQKKRRGGKDDVIMEFSTKIGKESNLVAVVVETYANESWSRDLKDHFRVAINKTYGVLRGKNAGRYPLLFNKLFFTTMSSSLHESNFRWPLHPSTELEYKSGLLYCVYCVVRAYVCACVSFLFKSASVIGLGKDRKLLVVQHSVKPGVKQVV